jgi:hypothetical protein
MEMSGNLHAQAALFARKEPLNPLEKSLDEPQSRSGHGDEEKILSLHGTEPRSPSPYTEPFGLTI